MFLDSGYFFVPSLSCLVLCYCFSAIDIVDLFAFYEAAALTLVLIEIAASVSATSRLLETRDSFLRRFTADRAKL
jgi:hypothetical protein